MGSKWNSELYCSLKRWKPRATPYHMQVWYPTEGQGCEDPHTTRPVLQITGWQGVNLRPVRSRNSQCAAYPMMLGSHLPLGLLKSDPAKLPTPVFPNHPSLLPPKLSELLWSLPLMYHLPNTSRPTLLSMSPQVCPEPETRVQGS